MSSDRLRENLDAIAEAVGGIAQLRALILQLAVQGKLVPQDSIDEKSRLASRDREEGSELPQGWRQATPEMLKANVPYALSIGPFGSNLLKEDYQASGIPLVFVREITSRRFGESKTKYVSEEKANELRAHWVYPGELLITKMGSPPGDTAVYPPERPPAVITADCIRFAVDQEVMLTAFAQIAIESPSTRSQIVDITQGIAHQKVSLKRFRTLYLPVPPIPEQKRIVAKVDELMALCDELEQKQEQRHTVRRAAHTSALEALTNAQTPDELAHAWQRLQKHWDVLAAHADAVPPLRQAILQLAVQGRLLAQDPDDEPAISLLSQIANRHAVARTGTDSSQNELYLLPSSWNWARFDAIAAIRSNLVDPASFRKSAHIAPNHIEKGTGRLLPYGSIGDDKVTSGKHRFYAGQILYSKIRPNLSKATLVDFEGLCSADMYPIEPWIDSRYLLTFILSETFLRQVTAEDNRVAMPKVNQEQLSMVRVAVPPLAEQKRIVARVDELMALCDSLEQRAREQEALASQLAHAAVAAVATG